MRRDVHGIGSSIRRWALGAVALAILLGATLSVPSSVAACLCGDLAEGDVVFEGRVASGPDDAFLLPEFSTVAGGVYAFDVKSAIRGDPLDGRVYSGLGSCTSAFEVGAIYRVHASLVEPGTTPSNAPPDVRLVAHLCMKRELLEAPPPLIGMFNWARSIPGVFVLGIGSLMLVGAVGYLWFGRRASSAPPAKSGEQGRMDL